MAQLNNASAAAVLVPTVAVYPPPCLLLQEKLYSLDLNKIRAGEDKRTTLMVKNIPNKYTQKMLLAVSGEWGVGLGGKLAWAYCELCYWRVGLVSLYKMQALNVGGVVSTHKMLLAVRLGLGLTDELGCWLACFCWVGFSGLSWLRSLRHSSSALSKNDP